MNKIKSSVRSVTFYDAIFLFLVPFVAAIITWYFPINLMVSTVIFFGPPALYISWKRKDIIWRLLIYSATISVISILTDYLAERDQSWVSTSMFEYKILGTVPIEALVWMFLFTYLIIGFYLYFFDNDSHRFIGKRMPYVFFAAIMIVLWMCAVVLFDAHFTIEYYYIKFGLLFFVPPLVVFLWYFPKYISKFLIIMPYFIIRGSIKLIVSLQKEHWSYPGQHFIGIIQIGSYRFPVEELVFWIILYTPFIISQFELFNNDNLIAKNKKNNK